MTNDQCRMTKREAGTRRCRSSFGHLVFAIRHCFVIRVSSFVIPALTAWGTSAAVHLSTDGYVRPGRYFPVEVRADGPVTLAADGCVPTDVAGGFRGTAPVWAVTTPAGELGGTPLRTPAEGERLVGATAALPAGAGELFPGDRLLPIRLDLADPLPGPPAAWEVLDAVVLDVPAMAAVTDAKRSALLAGGVMLAVAGDDRPDARWPWRRRGPWWVLAVTPAGPTEVVSPDVYGPTESWSPGWPAAVRGGAAGVAAVVGVVTVALFARGIRDRVTPRVAVAPQGHSSSRPKGAPAGRPLRGGGRWTAAAIAFPLLSGVAVLVWRSRLDPVARVRGDVTVTSPAWSQHDAWVYGRARSAAVATVPWAGWTHPAFASAGAAARARLTVSPDGSTAFRVPLAAGAAVAFVRREVGPAGVPPAITGGHGAAMRTVASLYLGRGDRVAGETPAPPGGWPGVAITRP